MLPKAERYVPDVARTGDVESIGRSTPCRLVTMARLIQHDDVVAGGYHDTGDLDILAGGPREGLHGRHPAQQLFDRQGYALRVGGQQGPLPGVIGEDLRSSGDEVAAGLHPGGDQHHAQSQ